MNLVERRALASLRGQGQSQVSNITKTFRPADLYQIGAQAAVSTWSLTLDQRDNSFASLLDRPTVSSYPHPLDTPGARTRR